jgi:hypothetical protein
MDRASIRVAAEGDVDVHASECRASPRHLRVHSNPSRPVERAADVRVLDVAPSGYDAWLKHPVSHRAQEDARLFRPIRASFVASQGIYGAPRVFLDLREAGETAASTAWRGSCARTVSVPFTAIARDGGRSASRPC